MKERTMMRIFAKRGWRVAGVTALMLVVVMGCMKLLAMRTHDPHDPRSRPNGFVMSYSVIVDKPPEEVFHFISYQNTDCYKSLTSAQKRFDIVNSTGLIKGAHIIAEDFIGGKGFKHSMVVHETIPNRLIYLASTPSHICTRSKRQTKMIGTCNCYVYYDLAKIAHNTLLTKTVVVEMPNFFTKFVADILSGNQAINKWRDHLAEELELLKSILERDERSATWTQSRQSSQRSLYAARDGEG